LEYDCSNGLHGGEDTEWVLARVEFEAEDLLSMRIDCAIHEAPAERERVDEGTLLVLLYHEKAEQPDQYDVHDVGIHTSFVAYPVDDLAHEERANHFTEAEYAQGQQAGDQLIT